MRDFSEFCKVAAPVFQEWNPKGHKVTAPDFSGVANAMRQAKKPIDTDAVMNKAYENARAVSLNQAVSNPHSKMGRRMRKNNEVYESIKPKIQSAIENNKSRAESGIRGANKMIPLGERAAEALKNNRGVQAGLTGAALLGVGLAAKKMYDKKKVEKAKQEAAPYQVQTYTSPQTTMQNPYRGDSMRSYEDFIKTAALNPDVKLRPHQQRVLDNPNASMVIAHGVGSGKTLTSIAKFEKLKAEGKANKALVITPSGLRDNFGEEGVGKFTDSTYNIVGNSQERRSKLRKGVDPNADYNIVSYELYRADPEKYLRESGADTVIADEAQKGKNEGALTTKALKDARPKYKNHLALTGSLVSNTVADALPLVDVTTNGDHSLGQNKRHFENRFIQHTNSKKHPVKFREPRTLAKEMASVIDYADYDDLKEVADMPDKDIQVRKVPLSREQAKIYKGLLKADKNMKKMVRAKRLETMSPEEAQKAYNKLVETRKLMNSIGSVKPGVSLSESAKITPKTRKILDDMEQHLRNTPDGQAILYSNLVNGGTDVLEAGLKDRQRKYGRFFGKSPKNGVTEESRQQDVRDYKAGKKRVMVISPAGAEGVSLGNTTWEGILDPHYNPEKMNQIEARGVRAGGLKGRDDRTVQINRYLATMPKTLGIFKSKLKTPDEAIYEIAQNKNVENQAFYNFLRKHQSKR